ncbi:MAG: hypothetical protein ACFB00_12750, partial [Parvularculaceae bacterium]
MSKVRLLFAADASALGERIALALAADGWALAFGAHDADDRDPRPVSATLAIWSPGLASARAFLGAAQRALVDGTLTPVTEGPPPPRGFEALAPMRLSGWDGGRDVPRWRFVLDELRRAAARDSRTAKRAASTLAEPAGATAAAEARVADLAAAPVSAEADVAYRAGRDVGRVEAGDDAGVGASPSPSPSSSTEPDAGAPPAPRPPQPPALSSPRSRRPLAPAGA